VAESLSIDALGAGAAESLAGDVEYRIHLILQEAKKFMVHGRRRTLLPEDVTFAMDALNVEVGLLLGRSLRLAYLATTAPTCATFISGAGSTYCVWVRLAANLLLAR
jgi:transcription initiation factor TFIID subunit 6